MRAVLIAVVLAAAPTAHGATQTVVVDKQRRWATPEEFRPRDVVRVTVYIRGDRVEDNTRSGRRLAWAHKGVIVEARVAERGPIRFSAANARRRDARVRVVYRLLSP